MTADKIFQNTIIIIFTITVLIMWGQFNYNMGTYDEKIAQLEDCIFNHKGCYYETK